ncbi:putative multi-domain containing protein [Aduncisulcus paluster]|uniref:Sodium/hydrogen exchanger n=1 Tax=Aduncisulcus paluster TaxID=2918883 RepID=A0ABQ5K0Y1_9EUKA|nr:putative multi-domain containing protein [Aduncisulcus paluster]
MLTILVYAVIGTILNTFIIGTIVYAVRTVCNLDFSLPEAWAYGSLLAAVDPVAVLAIFEEAHVNESLFNITFGESVLNDAVSIVLYDVFLSVESLQEENYGLAAILGLGIAKFFIVFGGGIVTGIVVALITILASRFTRHATIVEPLLGILTAFLAFVIAEIFTFSGIISTLAAAIVVSRYMKPNFTRGSRITFEHLLKILASSMEGILFLIIGLALANTFEYFSDINWLLSLFVILTAVVGRFLVTLFLAVLLNINTSKYTRKVPYADAIILWVAGLRGAIAFALAFVLPSPPLEPETKTAFLYSTIHLIIFSVYVQGSLAKPMLEWLNVRRDRNHRAKLQSAIQHNREARRAMQEGGSDFFTDDSSSSHPSQGDSKSKKKKKKSEKKGKGSRKDHKKDDKSGKKSKKEKRHSKKKLPSKDKVPDGIGDESSLITSANQPDDDFGEFGSRLGDYHGDSVSRSAVPPKLSTAPWSKSVSPISVTASSSSSSSALSTIRSAIAGIETGRISEARPPHSKMYSSSTSHDSEVRSAFNRDLNIDIHSSGIDHSDDAHSPCFVHNAGKDHFGIIDNEAETEFQIVGTSTEESTSLAEHSSIESSEVVSSPGGEILSADEKIPLAYRLLPKVGFYVRNVITGILQKERAVHAVRVFFKRVDFALAKLLLRPLHREEKWLLLSLERISVLEMTARVRTLTGLEDEELQRLLISVETYMSDPRLQAPGVSLRRVAFERYLRQDVNVIQPTFSPPPSAVFAARYLKDQRVFAVVPAVGISGIEAEEKGIERMGIELDVAPGAPRGEKQKLGIVLEEEEEEIMRARPPSSEELLKVGAFKIESEEEIPSEAVTPNIVGWDGFVKGRKEEEKEEEEAFLGIVAPVPEEEIEMKKKEEKLRKEKMKKLAKRREEEEEELAERRKELLFSPSRDRIGVVQPGEVPISYEKEIVTPGSTFVRFVDGMERQRMVGQLRISAAHKQYMYNDPAFTAIQTAIRPTHPPGRPVVDEAIAYPEGRMHHREEVANELIRPLPGDIDSEEAIVGLEPTEEAPSPRIEDTHEGQYISGIKGDVYTPQFVYLPKRRNPPSGKHGRLVDTPFLPGHVFQEEARESFVRSMLISDDSPPKIKTRK